MADYRTMMVQTYRKSKEQPNLTTKELDQIQTTFERQERELIEDMTRDKPKQSLKATKQANMARMVAREIAAADMTEFLSNL